jgi:hypothetical protein
MPRNLGLFVGYCCFLVAGVLDFDAAGFHLHVANFLGLYFFLAVVLRLAVLFILAGFAHFFLRGAATAFGSTVDCTDFVLSP